MAPVIIRLNRRRCVLLGGLYAAMTLLFLPAVVIPLTLGIFDWLIAAGIATAAFFGWFALYFLGIARKNPVALRMDDKGVSGFYADPASWAEIKSVFSFAGHKSHRFLGFELHDPESFRDRQSPWRRYLSWANGRQHKAHLVVPEMVLADTTADALAAQAQQLLDSHRRCLARRHMLHARDDWHASPHNHLT